MTIRHHPAPQQAQLRNGQVESLILWSVSQRLNSSTLHNPLSVRQTHTQCSLVRPALCVVTMLTSAGCSSDAISGLLLVPAEGVPCQLPWSSPAHMKLKDTVLVPPPPACVIYIPNRARSQRALIAHRSPGANKARSAAGVTRCVQIYSSPMSSLPGVVDFCQCTQRKRRHFTLETCPFIVVSPHSVSIRWGHLHGLKQPWAQKRPCSRETTDEIGIKAMSRG